jgi:hypothetical protein
MDPDRLVGSYAKGKSMRKFAQTWLALMAALLIWWFALNVGWESVGMFFLALAVLVISWWSTAYLLLEKD